MRLTILMSILVSLYTYFDLTCQMRALSYRMSVIYPLPNSNFSIGGNFKQILIRDPGLSRNLGLTLCTISRLSAHKVNPRSRIKPKSRIKICLKFPPHILSFVRISYRTYTTDYHTFFLSNL